MMIKEEFLKKMEEILDTEAEISMEDRLEDFEEWDSLAFVSFLAMAKTSCDHMVEPQKVREARTLADLFHLMVL